jgi:hypothetical protein
MTRPISLAPAGVLVAAVAACSDALGSQHLGSPFVPALGAAATRGSSSWMVRRATWP